MKTMAEVLEEVWDDGNCTGLDGWIGPGRGAGEVDDYALLSRERAIRKAAATLAAAGYGPVKEAQAGAWDAAVNEADRQWQIGHASAAILKADNPYRAATKDAEP